MYLKSFLSQLWSTPTTFVVVVVAVVLVIVIVIGIHHHHHHHPPTTRARRSVRLAGHAHDGGARPRGRTIAAPHADTSATSVPDPEGATVRRSCGHERDGGTGTRERQRSPSGGHARYGCTRPRGPQANTHATAAPDPEGGTAWRLLRRTRTRWRRPTPRARKRTPQTNTRTTATPDPDCVSARHIRPTRARHGGSSGGHMRAMATAASYPEGASTRHLRRTSARRRRPSPKEDIRATAAPDPRARQCGPSGGQTRDGGARL